MIEAWHCVLKGFYCEKGGGVELALWDLENLHKGVLIVRNWIIVHSNGDVQEFKNIK